MQLSHPDNSAPPIRAVQRRRVSFPRQFEFEVLKQGLSGTELACVLAVHNARNNEKPDVALTTGYFMVCTNQEARTVQRALTVVVDRGILIRTAAGKKRFTYRVQYDYEQWGRSPLRDTDDASTSRQICRQVAPPLHPLIRKNINTRSNDPTNHPPTPQPEDRVVEEASHISSNPFRPGFRSDRKTKPTDPASMPDVPSSAPDPEMLHLVIRPEAPPQNVRALMDATAALEAAYGKDAVRDALLEARERSASDPVRYARGILRRDPLFRRTSGERTNFNTLAASPGSDGAKRVVRAFMEAMKLPFLDETVDASLRYAEKVISDLLAASTDVPDREAAVGLAEHCAAVVPNFPARTMIVDRMELFERHLAKFYKLARNRHDAALAFAPNPATMNDADAAQFALRAKLAMQLRAHKPR